MLQVPTFEVQGLKPLDFSIWYALMGPARMPPDFLALIYSDVQKVLAEPAVRDNLSNAGVEPLAGNGADLAKLITSDLVRHSKLAKTANIKAEQCRDRRQGLARDELRSGPTASFGVLSDGARSHIRL